MQIGRGKRLLWVIREVTTLISTSFFLFLFFFKAGGWGGGEGGILRLTLGAALALNRSVAQIKGGGGKK